MSNKPIPTTDWLAQRSLGAMGRGPRATNRFEKKATAKVKAAPVTAKAPALPMRAVTPQVAAPFPHSNLGKYLHPPKRTR